MQVQQTEIRADREETPRSAHWAPRMAAVAAVQVLAQLLQVPEVPAGAHGQKELLQIPLVQMAQAVEVLVQLALE